MTQGNTIQAPFRSLPEIGAQRIATGLLPTSVLLTRIRAGIAASANGYNCVERPPLLPPLTINTGPGNAIRANTTAYPVGYVFTNAAGTHQFVMRVTGTTAAAEPAAVTTPLVTATPYNMGDIADGTATITWMGPVRVTTANPLAPVISSGAKPAQLSTAVNFFPGAIGVPYGAANNSLFQFTGGTGTIVGNPNNFLVYWLGNKIPSGGSTQIDPAGLTGFGPQSSAVTFMTDASLLALDFSTGAQSSGLSTTTGVYMEVDGVRVMDGMFLPQVALAAGSGFILVDFRANGGRKPRKIRFSLCNNSTFQPAIGRFYVQPQDSVWYPANPNRYRIALVGDSTGSGSASSQYLASYDRATTFANLIGCDDISNLGSGGTGYIATNNGAAFNYQGRFADVVKLNPDVLYVCNNFNDNGTVNGTVVTSAARVAAIVQYLTVARTALPTALIIVGGTIGGVAPSSNATLEADMQTAVAQFADPYCFFLPEDSDTPPWETGTGNLGATNGTGNNDIYKGPTDTIHPSLLGIQYIAQRDANAFRNLIASLG